MYFLTVEGTSSTVVFVLDFCWSLCLKRLSLSLADFLICLASSLLVLVICKNEMDEKHTNINTSTVYRCWVCLKVSHNCIKYIKKIVNIKEDSLSLFLSSLNLYYCKFYNAALLCSWYNPRIIWPVRITHLVCVI